jgi:hypothetical protein
MIRCVNSDIIEYTYFLYLLVLTVRDETDTGTQIHLLVYSLMYRMYIVYVVNDIISILF